MMKTQFLCFGLKEDQRYLKHVNVITRIWITNSCKFLPLHREPSASKAFNQKWWGRWRGHLTSTSASGGSLELGCVRKHQAAGTRCGVPEHYHCTALLYSSNLPWQLWQILLIDRKGISIIIFTLMASCDEKSGYPGTVLCSELALQLSPI